MKQHIFLKPNGSAIFSSFQMEIKISQCSMEIPSLKQHSTSAEILQQFYPTPMQEPCAPDKPINIERILCSDASKQEPCALWISSFRFIICPHGDITCI